jgi:hypothetical protein
MAEAALYSNPGEPPFPFELLRDRLSWVPAYIDRQCTKRGRNIYEAQHFEALVNTLLVCTRARTSALFGTADISLCEDFATRLNRILRSLPNKIGARHEIELVERGHSHVWVTCRHSPRFIWKRRLNHRETGLNLDFAAPGHIRPSRNCPAVVSHIVEISGPVHASIVSENIRLDYVDDRVMQDVEAFIQHKTALFNSTMVRLKLPYRFDHFLSSSGTDQHVAETMRLATPPSSEWWNGHYYFVGRVLPYNMTFCSRETLFELYWLVIQQVYDFEAKLPLIYLVPEFSEDLENVLAIVYRNTQPSVLHSISSSSSSTPLPPTELAEQISEVLRSLVIDNEQLLSNFPFEKRYNDIRRSGVYCLWKATSEWCKIRILERWKLCVPMSSSHMEKWPVEGNQLLLSGLPGKKPLLLTIKDFWKARPV